MLCIDSFNDGVIPCICLIINAINGCANVLENNFLKFHGSVVEVQWLAMPPHSKNVHSPKTCNAQQPTASSSSDMVHGHGERSVSDKSNMFSDREL